MIQQLDLGKQLRSTHFTYNIIGTQRNIFFEFEIATTGPWSEVVVVTRYVCLDRKPLSNLVRIHL
jgi:hypothetical protein